MAYFNLHFSGNTEAAINFINPIIAEKLLYLETLKNLNCI